MHLLFAHTKFFSTNSYVNSLYGVQWSQFIFMQKVLPSCCVILWFNFLGGCIPIDSGTAFLLQNPLCFIDFKIIVHLLLLVPQTGFILPFLAFCQPEPNSLLAFWAKWKNDWTEKIAFVNHNIKTYFISVQYSSVISLISSTQTTQWKSRLNESVWLFAYSNISTLLNSPQDFVTAFVINLNGLAQEWRRGGS